MSGSLHNQVEGSAPSCRGNFALNCVIIFLRPPHSFLTVINQFPTIKTHLKAGETVQQLGALVAFAKNPRFSSQKLHSGSKPPITAGQTHLLNSSGSRHPGHMDIIVRQNYYKYKDKTNNSKIKHTHTRTHLILSQRA